MQLPLTCDKTELRLRVDAGQVGLLLFAVILGLLPRLGHLRLELVAEVSVQQVPLVAVGVCGTATPSVSYHYALTARCRVRGGGRADLAARWAWLGSGHPSSRRCSPAS